MSQPQRRWRRRWVEKAAVRVAKRRGAKPPGWRTVVCRPVGCADRVMATSVSTGALVSLEGIGSAVHDRMTPACRTPRACVESADDYWRDGFECGGEDRQRLPAEVWQQVPSGQFACALRRWTIVTLPARSVPLMHPARPHGTVGVAPRARHAVCCMQGAATTSRGLFRRCRPGSRGSRGRRRRWPRRRRARASRRARVDTQLGTGGGRSTQRGARTRHARSSGGCGATARPAR